MKTPQKRLTKNLVSLLLLKGLDFLIPVLTIPYLLRVIGVEKYGLIAFCYGFSLYTASIVQYGFNVTATKEIARNRQDATALQKIYSTTLFTSAALSVAAISISCIAIVGIESLRTEWKLALISLLQATAQAIFPIWLFQGIEKMGFITYLFTAAKVISLAGIFILIKTPNDYIYIPALYAIGSITATIAAILIIKRELGVKIECPEPHEIAYKIKAGRHAFIAQITPTLYNNSATFMLGLFAGPHATGIYSAATKVIDAAISLGYVASNAALPQLSRTIRFHKNFKIAMLISGLLASTLLLMNAQAIGEFLHPQEGMLIGKAISAASISVFLAFAILTYGTNYLMLQEQEALVAKINTYTSITFFGIGIHLINQYGMWGALGTLVAARAAMAIATYQAYRRHKSTNNSNNHE